MDDQTTKTKIEGLIGIVQQIAAGNFSARAPIVNNEELDALSTGINMLAEELSAREGDLHKKVKELQDLNQLFVNRELKMVDLKREIDELRKEVTELKARIK